MCKDHIAILDSLRQKSPRQAHEVQTKGTQSFQICDDLCWVDSQLSLSCRAGTAPQLCKPKQTEAEHLLEGPTLIYILLHRSPCARKSLWQGEEGPGKSLGSSPGHIKTTQALSAWLGGKCGWGSPAASHSGLRCGWLQAGSQPNDQHRQIFADLWSHSNTPDDPPNFSASFRSDRLWGPSFFQFCFSNSVFSLTCAPPNTCKVTQTSHSSPWRTKYLQVIAYLGERSACA